MRSISPDSWAHRLTRPLVRRLGGSAIRPNHLTLLRLLTGLAAVVCFAAGLDIMGGCWFLLSALLDRADGELARLTGSHSRIGHYFDLGSDAVVNSLVFVGIAAGLRADPLLGPWALGLGLVAGLSIAAIFWLVCQLEASGQQLVTGVAGFDPDDALFLVAPVAWVGWLAPLLVAAAIGAPLFLLLLAFFGRRLERARPHQRSADA
jgi:phosphatidylglycerophosphate synthase